MSHSSIARYTCDKCGKTTDTRVGEICIGTPQPDFWLQVTRNNIATTGKDFCSSECIVKYYQSVIDQRKTNETI